MVDFYIQDTGPAKPLHNAGIVSASMSYLIAASAASMLFVTLNYVSFSLGYDANKKIFSVEDRLGLAVIIYVGTGFLPALILMSLPWILAVKTYKETHLRSFIYFPIIGFTTLFLLSCMIYGRVIQVSSIAPPYLECLVIAAHRQGASFAMCGVLFGLIYRILTK